MGGTFRTEARRQATASTHAIDGEEAPPNSLEAMAEAKAPDPSEFSCEWARSALPSYGPGWDEAIRFGVDVTLLLENLARTPTERLRRLEQVADFHTMLREARRAGE